MRYKFPILIDCFFLAVCAFLLFLTAFRFYAEAAVSVVIALFFSALSVAIFYVFRTKNAERTRLSKEEDVHCRAVFRELGLTPTDKAREFLATIAERELGGRLISEGDGIFRDGSLGGYYYIHASIFPFTKEELCAVWRNHPNARPMTVIALGVDDEVKPLAKELIVTVSEPKRWYLAMKKQENFPTLQSPPEAERSLLKRLGKRIFCRKKSKRFFVFGVWMLFFSLFIPFPTYYLFSGSAFLLLSALSLVFGERESA